MDTVETEKKEGVSKNKVLKKLKENYPRLIKQREEVVQAIKRLKEYSLSQVEKELLEIEKEVYAYVKENPAEFSEEKTDFGNITVQIKRTPRVVFCESFHNPKVWGAFVRKFPDAVLKEKDGTPKFDFSLKYIKNKLAEKDEDFGGFVDGINEEEYKVVISLPVPESA
jgi:hypothetical protein